ncbi:MAG: S-methyl-5-thioribose-1-phosphate isomerase [Spirochaetes bacterium]|nr:S-methyl-5-thioribose-1-phosphate isomerase [Spirochaetota bacterium]
MDRLITFSDGTLYFIDQTRLPNEHIVDGYTDYRDVCAAIKILKVRGAPAIGVAAGYAVALAAHQFIAMPFRDYAARLTSAADELAATRPTAVNLFYALNRMRNVITAFSGNDNRRLCDALLAEAHAIADEDNALGRKLGTVGAALLKDGDVVMTICNAGSLATAGIGSALSCIYIAKEQGKRVSVYALETRPLLQGARLTTYELSRNGIAVTLITDGMAGVVMKTKGITAVITGADRIAANGDAANKVGTYGLSVLAKHHGIPFYVAAPRSTFDLSIPSGASIPIEERSAEEITVFNGKRIAPEGICVYNPAFDVAPAEHITGIITEDGVLTAPYRERIQKLWGGASHG